MTRNPTNLPVQRLGRAGASVISSANPLEVILAGVEYLKIHDQEQTKRLEISAKLQIALETLRAERELMSGYFDRVFAERREELSRLHEYLDRAIESRDSETMAVALNGIVGIVKSCPLLGYSEFRQKLKSGAAIEF